MDARAERIRLLRQQQEILRKQEETGRLLLQELAEQEKDNEQQTPKSKNEARDGSASEGRPKNKMKVERAVIPEAGKTDRPSQPLPWKRAVKQNIVPVAPMTKPGGSSTIDSDDIYDVPDRDSPAPQLPPRKRGRPSHLLPEDSDEEYEEEPSAKKKRKKHSPKADQGIEGAQPKCKSLSWTQIVQAKYPQLSKTDRYGMIVYIGDHAVELACCFCDGNHYYKSGSLWALSGVVGFQRHIAQSHKDDLHGSGQSGDRDCEWVTKHCVKKLLLKSDVEDVKAGRYAIQVVRVLTAAEKKKAV